MATRISPPQNKTYYINPAYLTFVENSGYGANLIQVSASSSCYISVYDPANGIGYSDADRNYQRWKVTAYNNKFPSNEKFYIYVRLERSGTSALVIYDTVLRGVKGGEITVSKDENGNDVYTEAESTQDTYWYIRIGEVGETDGASIREITYDTGYLTSDEGRDASSLNEMWELDKYTTPWLIKAKQWLQSFTVKGFITLMGGLLFKKGENEKPVTDIKRSTDSDEDVPVSDETIPTTQYVSNQIEELDDKFLRKDQDDKTPHSLGVGKDLTVDGKTISKGGIQLGEIFQSGFLGGKGALIDEAGRAELESLFVRTFLEVPELRYNRVTVRMGDSITSSAAGIIEEVDPDKDADGNVLPSGTLTLKLEKGEYGSLVVGDLVMQIFSDMSEEGEQNNSKVTSDDGKGNRHIKGFATVMFEVTDVSGDRNETVRYSLRYEPGVWETLIHPYKFGTFSQRGNRRDEHKDRQVIIYEGLYPQPYTRYMFGVNDWEFTAKMIGMQLGDLSNLSVFGMDMTGYSAYLNNVYFTGMIRQLYIPQWMDGESAAQNGTLVYMGGDHYVSKGDTNNPPLFDLADENGNSLLFTDEEGEGNLLDLNNEEYDMFAKKGEDGVGIKSNVSYYMITDTNEKPLESSSDWSSSMVQPTDLKPYLWKKTVVTYTNLTSQTTIECISVRGKDGTSVSIKGSFNSEAELKAAFPSGPNNASDAYIVGGDLYVWTGSEWKNVGAIKGEKGDTAYIHMKYANETASGTQVTVGGSVYTLSFTSNDGEDVGDWLGIYTDFVQADSMNISDYKWKNIKGSKGDDSTSYSMDSSVSVVNFSNTGYPTPDNFIVTCKKKTGNGNVVACSDFYLATWKYDGTWQLVKVSSFKTSSVQVAVASTLVYTQYRVTAHATASATEENIILRANIGVSVNGKDGEKGEAGKDGEDGIFVYDAGYYDSSREYYYQKIEGKVRRDKIVYGIGGSFYNFLVRARQEDGSTGLINTPPTKAAGDTNWEVMSQFKTIVADTIFGTNANIGGFMVSAEKMLSQTDVTDSEGNTESAFELNGSKGTMTMRQSGGTVWQLDGQGIQSVGNSDGERIVIDPNSRSISSYDAKGVERTVIDGSEYTLSELTGASGGTVTLTSNANNTSGFTASVTNMGSQTLTYPISSMFQSAPGTLSVSISSMEVKTTFHPEMARAVTTSTDTDDYVTNPVGEIIVYVETYETSTSIVPLSRKLVAVVSADGSVLGGTVSNSTFQNVSPVVIGKGYHKLVANLTARNGNTNGVTTVVGTWVINSATVSVESYVSRHFANGMFLSKSSSEHFLAMTDGGVMAVQVASGGHQFRIKNGSFTVDGASQPITVYAARVTDDSTSQSVAPTVTEITKVSGMGAVGMTKLSSPQRYRIDFPATYGLTASNMLVNLTGYGVCAGTDNNAAKATLKSYSVTSDGIMRVEVMVSDDETPNFGGFYIEVRKLM